MAVAKSNTTLNEIVTIFKDIADRHLQLNDFGFGTTDEIGEARKMLYPYLWVTVIDDSNLVMGNNGGGFSYIDFSLTIIVADKVNQTINSDDKLGEQSTNGLEVSSDTQQIIYDIITRLASYPSYQKMNISLVNDVAISPAWDEDDGRVNAWTATLDLRMPFRLTYCEAPFDDTFTPTPPLVCEDGTILINGISFGSVSSGGSIDILVINSDSDSVGSTVGSDYVIDDTILTVNGDDYVTVPAEQPFDIVVRNTDGDIVGTPNGTEIEVPAGATVKSIGYARPKRTQQISYVIGDEGWDNINNTDTYVFDPFTEDMACQDPKNWWKLLTMNAFGNYNRFTSKNGGYYDFSDGNYKTVNGITTTYFDEFKDGDPICFAGYVVDNLTGLGFLSKPLGAATFVDFINIYIPGYNSIGTNKYHSFTDWKIPSLGEALSIKTTEKGANTSDSYYPADLNSISPFVDLHRNILTTSTYLQNTSFQYRINVGGILLATFNPITSATYDGTLCRYHFGS